MDYVEQHGCGGLKSRNMLVMSHVGYSISDQKQVPKPTIHKPNYYPNLVVSTARCRWDCVERQSIMDQQTLKRKAEEAVNQPLKKAKPTPSKHGQRLFFEAKIFWFDQYGPKRGDKVKLLLDCGCTGPILNRNFVQRQHMPWVKRNYPITIQTADGKPMEGAGDKHTEEVILRIGTHQEELTWEISGLEDGIDGYLPISWLQLHNPDVQWDTGKMTWRSDYCKKHCLPMTIKEAARGFIQMIEKRK